MSTSNILNPTVKGEILEAYHRLKTLTAQNKNTITQPNRSQVVSALEEIENILSQKTEEMKELERQISDLKEQRSLGKRLMLTQETLEFLQDTFSQEEAEWERRKRNLEEELAQKEADMKKRLAKEFEGKKTLYQSEESQKEKPTNGDEDQLMKKEANSNDVQSRNEIFSSKHALEIKAALVNSQNKNQKNS